MSDFKPKVVCFSCKFSWGYLADEAALSSQIKNWIPIICSGKVDAKHMVEAFQHGADGVLILVVRRATAIIKMAIWRRRNGCSSFVGCLIAMESSRKGSEWSSRLTLRVKKFQSW